MWNELSVQLLQDNTGENQDNFGYEAFFRCIIEVIFQERKNSRKEINPGKKKKKEKNPGKLNFSKIKHSALWTMGENKKINKNKNRSLIYSLDLI